MIKRTVIILLLLSANLMLYPRAYTTIRGSIQGASGYSIRLLTWSDQVTFIEKKLASATIDDQGNFNLIAELSVTTFAFFSIGNIRSDIILEPGQAYEVIFSNYPSETYLETRNLLLQNEKLDYTLVNQGPEDLNLVAAEATKMVNRFLADHYMDIYLRKTAVTDAFIDTFFLRFGEHSHPWIREMVDYRIASLKLSGYKISMEIAWDLWLKDHDFDYHHPDFMDFFNQLFSQYLTTRLKHYTYNELLQVVNQEGSYFALSELIGRDTLLRNEVLREMVMLKGLGEVIHNRDFARDKVLKILSYMAAASKFREHRMIASNLMFLNTRFDKGVMAPDFSLPDHHGGKLSISDLRGKYLYIAFTMSNCIPCQAELAFLASIYPALQPNLEIMTVGLDPNPGKFWKAIEQQKYPWRSVHFNNDFELTDRYGIRNYPFFILIAPDGSFETYDARQPSAQFQPWFEEMVLKQK